MGQLPNWSGVQTNASALCKFVQKLSSILVPEQKCGASSSPCAPGNHLSGPAATFAALVRTDLQRLASYSGSAPQHTTSMLDSRTGLGTESCLAARESLCNTSLMPTRHQHTCCGMDSPAPATSPRASAAGVTFLVPKACLPPLGKFGHAGSRSLSDNPASRLSQGTLERGGRAATIVSGESVTDHGAVVDGDARTQTAGVWRPEPGDSVIGVGSFGRVYKAKTKSSGLAPLLFFLFQSPCGISTALDWGHRNHCAVGID